MITINTKNKEVNIPDKWEDLTTTQFISLSALLRRFIQNEIDLFDFRINLLGILSGYKRSKKRKFRKHRSLINERIFIIADMLVFPIKPYYPKPEQLEVFSEKFKIELQTRFLFEIFDVNYLDEKETAENFLEYEPSINYNIKKNLLPSFTHNETLYTGPFFNIDENGVLETDLTALEYIDASEYVSLFRDTGDKRYIAAVAAVLYRDDRSFYKSSDAQKNIDSFTKINPDILSAILLIFNNIISFFNSCGQYSILFQTNQNNEQASKGSDLGAIRNVYSLSKSGFGTLSEISSYLVTDYLNIMVDQIETTVRELRSVEMSDNEIALKLGLTLTQIQNI